MCFTSARARTYTRYDEPRLRTMQCNYLNFPLCLRNIQFKKLLSFSPSPLLFFVVRAKLQVHGITFNVIAKNVKNVSFSLLKRLFYREKLLFRTIKKRCAANLSKRINFFFKILPSKNTREYLHTFSKSKKKKKKRTNHVSLSKSRTKRNPWIDRWRIFRRERNFWRKLNLEDSRCG